MNSESLFDKTVLRSYHSFLYLYTRRITIMFIAILGGILGILYALNNSTKYVATESFVLSSESKAANLSGLASQFGIDLGNGSGTDLFSGDNIISLFYSKAMIKRVIFKLPPEGSDLLINLIVRDYKLDKKWQSNYFKDCFPFQNKPLSKIQDSLVNEILNKIKSDLLEVSRPDRNINVYTVTTNSKNEIVSCYLTRLLVDETAKFYIETKTRLARQNLTMLQYEADSIKKLLNTSIYAAGSEVDKTFNLNPALQVKRTSIQRQQISSTVLTAAYGEVIKNLELAKINLQKETPLYQILDIPETPLKAKRVSKLLAAVIGMLILLFLSIPALLIIERVKRVKVR